MNAYQNSKLLMGQNPCPLRKCVFVQGGKMFENKQKIYLYK